MGNNLPVGAEARREIAAILAKGILTLTKSEKERQFEASQLAMPQSDDNDSTVSKHGGISNE